MYSVEVLVLLHETRTHILYWMCHRVGILDFKKLIFFRIWHWKQHLTTSEIYLEKKGLKFTIKKFVFNLQLLGLYISFEHWPICYVQYLYCRSISPQVIFFVLHPLFPFFSSSCCYSVCIMSLKVLLKALYHQLPLYFKLHSCIVSE